MSFEDTIDLYRDLAAFEKETRQNRAMNREPDITAIEQLGHYVQRLNNGNHIKISFLQFWPTTGAWHNPIKKRRGTLEDHESLAGLVKREVGEPRLWRRKPA